MTIGEIIVSDLVKGMANIMVFSLPAALSMIIINKNLLIAPLN
jgi:hypothetical protein